MKRRILYHIGLCAIGCMLFACSQEEPAPAEPAVPEAPEGRRAVRFSLAGMIAEPFDGLANESRAAEADKETEAALENETPVNLPDGTTLWLFAEDISTGLPEGELDKVVSKSYVVRDIDGMVDEDGHPLQQLLPCEVDEEGKVESESSVPLYLANGHTYRFRAVSPARKFVEGAHDEADNPVYAFYVNNKEYVIATDDRYEKTESVEITIGDDGEQGSVMENGVQVVKMKPLINQTAQLEFTIKPEEKDGEYIHSISVLPQGIEISGVQDRYCYPKKGDESGNEHIHWNWSTGEPLHAYTGDNNTSFLIRKDEQYVDAFVTENADGTLYIKCPILPTNAFSTSIIVIFNLQINGAPTQYEMMLNQKIFKAAYTYHYIGKVSIQDGVTVITWQYVNWSDDVPIIPLP